jgi:hypothetical protein
MGDEPKGELKTLRLKTVDGNVEPVATRVTVGAIVYLNSDPSQLMTVTKITGRAKEKMATVVWLLDNREPCERDFDPRCLEVYVEGEAPQEVPFE